MNHLLVVGFYLINLGYVALALRVGYDVERPRRYSIEALSRKVGLVLLVLGLHALLQPLRLQPHAPPARRLESNLPPVEPDACLAAGAR